MVTAETITDEQIRELQDSIPSDWPEPRRDALIDACESALGFQVLWMPSAEYARHHCANEWNNIHLQGK